MFKDIGKFYINLLTPFFLPFYSSFLETFLFFKHKYKRYTKLLIPKLFLPKNY